MAQQVKKISEDIIVRFDFLDQMRFLEVLSAPVVTISILSGLDPAPSFVLSGAASVSGSVVSQKIVNGNPGVIYLLSAQVTGSSGAIYVKVLEVAILSDEDSYVAHNNLTLVGTLPDGIVGVPYSSNLLISGGYPPYVPVGLIPNAPTWMGFSISSNQLVCAGLPNEAVATSYNFTPQVRDSFLNTASAPQNIDITRIVVSGNLPDGEVGIPYDFFYTAAFGTPPYTFQIKPGDTFIPGVSLGSDGHVTDTPTTPGTFNFSIRGTDANGVIDDHPDEVKVAMFEWWLMRDNVITNPPPTVDYRPMVWRSPTPTGWVNPNDVRSNWIPPFFGAVMCGDDVALIINPSGTVIERITNFTPSGGVITSTQITVGTGIRRLVFIDDVVVGITNTPTWFTSTDRGATWTTHTEPGGRNIRGINKVAGRWVAVRELFSDFRCVFSGQVVPSTWSDGSVPGAGTFRNESVISSNGTAAAVFLTSGNSMRTTDGITWITSAVGHTIGDVRDATIPGFGSTLFIAGQSQVYRSTDGGASWTSVLTVSGSVERLVKGGGYVVASGGNVAGTSYIHYSVDDGLNWLEATHPVPTATADKWTATLVRKTTP